MDYENAYKDLLKSYTNLANYSYRQNEELYKLRREVLRITIENDERANIINDMLVAFGVNKEELKARLEKWRNSNQS